MARKMNEKTEWIIAQLKNGKATKEIIQEETVKGFKMFGPQVYTLKKKFGPVITEALKVRRERLDRRNAKRRINKDIKTNTINGTISM